MRYSYDKRLIALACLFFTLGGVAYVYGAYFNPQLRYVAEGFIIDKQSNSHWGNFIVIERSSENHQAITRLDKDLWNTVVVGETFARVHFYCNELGDFWEVMELT